MKKKWIWIIPLVLVLLIGGVRFFNGKTFLIFWNKGDLDSMTAVATDPSMADGARKYGNWTVYYDEAWDVVTFVVRYRGFGPASRMRGFYYSPTGEPSGRGNDISRENQGKGIQFTGEGDNWTYTEKIAPNWFWFEQNW